MIEDELRREKEKAEKYLDVAGVIFVVLDSNGRISLINKKGCEVLGYQAEEMIGKDWFDNFLPKRDKDVVRSVFDQLMTGAINPDKGHSFENSVVNKYGEERVISWRNTVLSDRERRIIGTLSSGEDITEKKQAEEAIKESEERYRTTTETAADAIICMKPPGIIYLWNRKAKEMFGYSADEAIGKDLHILITPDRYREKAYEGVKMFFETGIGPMIDKTIEIEAIRKDGTEFPVELSISGMNVKDN